MKKINSYQNQKFANKDTLKHTTSSIPKQISFSIIISARDQYEQIKHFFETIKRIKQENYSKFELIIVTNNSSQEVLSEIDTNIICKVLKEQHLLKIIEGNSSAKTKSIYLGICNATKENILVFDIEKLTNSFNFNDLFSIKKDINNKIALPVFQTKIKTKKTVINYSLVIVPLNIAKILYSNLLLSDTNYQIELKYRINQMGIKVEEFSISQQSPFKVTNPNFYLRLLNKQISRINWFFIQPLKELNKKTDKQSLPEIINESSIYRFSFATFALILFFLMPILSYNTGNSGDEDNYQYPQALKIYNYYTTFGNDTSYKNMQGMESYGMSFDTFTVFWNKIFNVDKIFETRHAMNGMVGWFTILFCGLLAYRLANWRAGLITMFLLFFSPPFLGQSFNNPKDIPFAMTYIFTIYYIVRFIQQFPLPTKKIIFLTSMGIALSISIRVGGILLIFYLLFFSGLHFFITTKYKELFSRDSIIKLKKIVVYILIISIIGYFMGLILWPYALESPLRNPYKALRFMSNFSASLLQLFEGKLIWSDCSPNYYIIKYILITAPISVIFGSIIYFITFRKKKLEYLWTFILFFSFGFPIFFIIYKHSNVYNGWRHVLFTYPPLIIAAGLGFNRLIDFIKYNNLKIFGLIAVVILSYNPIVHTIKNHPYEYVYFNELTGGVKGAYGNYDLDYYFHSIKEASEWIKINAKKENPNDKSKIIIATWLTAPLKYYLRKDTSRFEVATIDYYERGNIDWDYSIFTTHVTTNPAQLKNGTFPPSNTIHTIDVDGKPICVILKRTDKNDFLGYQALQKNDTINTIPYFLKALDVLPTNETALLNIADAYSRVKKYDSADINIKKLLKFNPESINALYSQSVIYYYKNDFVNALKTCNQAIKINSRNYLNYYVAANIYFEQKDFNSAKAYLQKCVEYNRGYKPAYMLFVKIANLESDNNSVQRYMNIVNQLQ